MLCSELTREESVELYNSVLKDHDAKAMRDLCLKDLFFLLVVGCKRSDINRNWIYDRCREVEAGPDGYLDLWSREHYKSSIITFGKTIQDILIDAEETFGIFSHTRPIAKAFLSQIKREFEQNTFLQDLFPDILYKNPQKDSPKWSLDEGIIVKRKSNPKECTIEAHGLVDGQPTSRHYKKLVYDDVVTKESVTTPEQIKKTTDAWALSLNLGAGEDGKRRYIGTRYHANDTYKTIMDRQAAIPRVYPATEDGTATGKPVLLTRETLAEKYREMGPYIFGAQMLQNPLADNMMGFDEDWLEYYNDFRNIGKRNIYVLVDPAGEKKKVNDYTVILVIALAEDNNYYLLDGLRDRLNLTERTVKLFEFVRKWKPKGVGYEKYGKDSDIEHIKYVMEQESYRFAITELGGPMPKNDRIRRLVPIFEQRRWYLPHMLAFTSVDGKCYNLIQILKNEEYLTFPVCTHDDILDCAARITDPKLLAVFPKHVDPIQAAMNKRQDYNPLKLKVQRKEYVPI